MLVQLEGATFIKKDNIAYAQEINSSNKKSIKTARKLNRLVDLTKNQKRNLIIITVEGYVFLSAHTFNYLLKQLYN
ncbi:MAG: extracellular matrix/biofilm biosynthesis regulator RemA family protein [bacterium]